MLGRVRFLNTGLKLAVIWLLAGFAPAYADINDWKLSRAEGVVRVMLPGAPITRARETMSLPQGTVITTGRNSSAILSRDGQQIDMAADTRLTVAQSGRGMTVIRQEAGSAYYQVDKQSMPHFRVDTSLLAAVVKGTGFTVVAGGDADRVFVSDGLVEVELQANGQSVDLSAGETAVVDRDAPGELQLLTGDPSGSGSEGAPAAASTETRAPPPEKTPPPKKKAEQSGSLSDLMPSPQVLATLIILGLALVVISIVAVWARRKR